MHRNGPSQLRRQKKRAEDRRVFADHAYDDTQNETEEVDAAELARDNNVKRVIVSSVTKPIEKKSDVEAEIK